MTTSTNSTDADPGPGTERLQKFLARAGVASRRGAEDLIAAGRVSVNGEVVMVPGTRIDPAADTVAVDGETAGIPETLWYVMLNKPAGVVTTMDDPQGRPTVVGYIPEGAPRLFPIGRLDRDTTGLLLLTNDGELAHSLMHPRFHVPKVYLAEVDGVPDEQDLRTLRDGVDLDDGRTSAAEVEVAERRRSTSVVRLTIREGRKRQVRRMLSAVGHPVRALERIAYGPLPLGALAPGRVRALTDDEVAALRAASRGEA